jgi:predicted metal-binding protein
MLVFLDNDYVRETYETKESSGVRNFSENSQANFNKNNELKRKHTYDKERKNSKHKGYILVCEFCQKENTTGNFIKSLTSSKSLCLKCYQYEYRHGYLLPFDERRKRNVKDKNTVTILTCGFCQKKSTHDQNKKSKFSSESLCDACYRYESKYGYLLPLDERRKYNVKHKYTILVCEFCQRESTTKSFIKSQISGNSLCSKCYSYESRHGYLLPVDERKENRKYKRHVALVCEFCEQESTTGRFKKGKSSGKVLCDACYCYEYKYGYLVRRNERRRNRKDQHNRLINTENFQIENDSKKQTVYTKHDSEKQFENTDEMNIAQNKHEDN